VRRKVFKWLEDSCGMTEVNSSREEGRAFYYKELRISFSEFKELKEEDINRIHRGFTQTLIYDLNGTLSLDFSETHNNYKIFISNLGKLNGQLSKDLHKKADIHNNLVEKVYNDYFLTSPFFNVGNAFDLNKKNGFRKEFSVYFKTGTPEEDFSHKDKLNLEQELLKLDEGY
jgi:hypothetical protein